MWCDLASINMHMARIVWLSLGFTRACRSASMQHSHHAGGSYTHTALQCCAPWTEGQNDLEPHQAHSV